MHRFQLVAVGTDAADEEGELPLRATAELAMITRHSVLARMVPRVAHLLSHHMELMVRTRDGPGCSRHCCSSESWPVVVVNECWGS